MSASLSRNIRRALTFAVGAAGIGCILSKYRERKNYAEYTYPSMFGTAEVFTLTTESNQPVRVLNVGGGFQSATYLGSKRFEPVFEYYRAFDHMFDSGNKVSRVLMLGGGGFSYPKHLLTTTKSVSIDVVEMDPAIVEIARKHFFVNELEQRYCHGKNARLGIYISDGLSFLANADDCAYDAVINDAFDGANPVVGLLTSSALLEAKRLLKKDGLYMLNAVIAEEDREMLHTYMEILLEGFSNVYAIRCFDEEFTGEDNWLLIASDGTHHFTGVEAMVSK